MKRIFTILFWLSVAVNVVGQQYAVVDGIYYGYAGDTAFLARTDGSNYMYSGDIVIPSQITINGGKYTVTAMERRAIASNFVTSVVLPGTIKKIPYEGFYGCVGLTLVTLQEGVTSIVKDAFYNCNNLTSITIPSSVTYIEGGALGRVSGIIVDTNNPIYDSRDNCNAVIETATNTLVTGCANTVIPNSVTSIGKYAFYSCVKLTSITIPENVKSIGTRAFDYCITLTSVTIPKGVTSIGSYPFYGCSALVSIKVADENPVYDSRNNCNAIIETATNTLIAACNNTLIPNGITSIGGGAFYGCAKMQSITVPNTVTEISDSAFAGCKSLTLVDIPDNVTSIGQSAFFECMGLTSISLSQKLTEIDNSTFMKCSSLASITIPSSVTTIGDRVFNTCANLSSIIIPSSVTSIGKYVFSYCADLASIKVEEGNPIYDSRNNCNAIIETATNTLKYGCMNTVIPNIVTEIDEYAFANHTNLTSLIIPNSVTKIGAWAFSGCSNLHSILIPNSVTEIGYMAFRGCSKLTSITIPEKITVFDGTALEGCSGLTQIFCSVENPPQIKGNYFPSATLYVLCDSYEAYKNHEYWGQFENIECRSLNALDMEDIAINDGEALPTIDLSEYFSSDDGEVVFSAKSSDNRVVYPVVMGNRLGFVQYGTGKAEITVTATVEPLSRSRSFTISINSETPPQDCELSLSAKITQPKCYGSEDGKIAVSVSGGTEPYYYKWNNGRTDGTLSGVSAGTYAVLVADENGCTAEKSFTIAEADSIAISETLTKPTCRKSNGKIMLNITGGTEPYTYLWNLPKNRIDVAKDLENLQSESYIINVTDKNSCKASKTINLPDNGAPTVKLKSVEPSKCLEATGSIEVEVSGGSSYSWSDSANVNKLIRPKLFPGNYTFKVSDNNGCRATMLVTVPMQQLRQPEISLVSYGDTAGHNLVIWQKEQTDEIEKYYVFRETKDAGNYDRIGSLAYNETSIYVDETANHNTTWCRYRISAANQCGESQLSYAYKTMRLQRKRVNGGLLLWWNSYEGFEFVKYTLYRLTNEGLEKYAELPANKYRYTVKELDPNTIGFFVTVELTEIVDVTQPMKAEGGPFAIAFSNLAEVENADAIEEVEENQAVVYSKDKKIIIVNAQNKNIFVCDVTGKIVAQRKNVEMAEIPVKNVGVYVVIVGKNVFKVIME